MDIVFIGTGPAITPAGRGNMAFVVRTAGLTLLFECGPLVLEELRRVDIDPSEIDTVLISHRHGDHTLGFPMLVLHRMIMARNKPLRVIVSRSLRPQLETLVALVYPEAAATMQRLLWCELDEERPDSLELAPGLCLRSQQVCGPEDVPVMGLRLDSSDGGSFTYSGDTSACERVAALAQGCDLLIHESNFSKRLEPDVDAKFYGHSTATQAAFAARLAGVRRLALVHLSGRYVGREQEVLDEARAVFSGEVLVPDDGDHLQV